AQNNWSPFNYGPPSQAEQLRQEDEGYSPRFHSVHVGIDCPTQFVTNTVGLDLEHAEDEQLYKEMTQKVEAMECDCVDAPYGTWMSWDWWQIHRATPARWR